MKSLVQMFAESVEDWSVNTGDDEIVNVCAKKDAVTIMCAPRRMR